MRNWTRPQWPKGRVDAAGEVLIDDCAAEPEKNFALSVIGNWRSSHGYPLHALKMTLKSRARRVDPGALVAQRLKRLSSIAAKLLRRDGMQLSRMHDIGGCRAVLKNAAAVGRLVEMYGDSRAKNPKTRAEFVKPYDYIKCPKEDGYRSIHLVYKYRSDLKKHECWNGLRIEIQIRSRLQHAWATAVETVDTFLGMGLKTKSGSDPDSPRWERFFALASSFIAMKERRPTVPNTPSDKVELVNEMGGLYKALKVWDCLQSWMTAMDAIQQTDAEQQAEHVRNAAVFLLTTNSNERSVSYLGFTAEKMKEAQDEYLRREKEAEPGVQSVLVSVESIEALKEAYPSYFADTRQFLSVLGKAWRHETKKQ